MMKLVIDTASEEPSVSLFKGDESLGEKRWEIRRDTSTKLLENIDELLKENKIELADVKKIEVAPGPAKRTSALRAGVTVANVLAYAIGAELRDAQAGEVRGIVVPRY